ncbi:MAG: ATP-binding protein [Acidimicrobiales bacterium]
MVSDRVAASQVRLDVDHDAAQLAEISPDLILVGDRPRLIDEWQLRPTLWDHVRRAVDDAGGEPGQFILAGSATPNDDARYHSGAGRIATMTMRPMTLHETWQLPGVSLTALLDGQDQSATGGTTDLEAVVDQLVLGGWPAQTTRPRRSLVTGYLDAAVNVDLATSPGADGHRPSRRRNPDKIRSLVASLARHVATNAGEPTLATDADLSREAVHDYLAALRRLMLIEPLRAFNTHLRSSRNLRQASRHHFVDPSLAAAALDADTGRLLADLNYTGLLFESMAIRDLRVLAGALGGAVSYFQTDDHEIDAVVSLPDRRWAGIEIKLGGQPAIDQGATSVAAAAASIDQTKAGPPAFLAVVTAVGEYAYRRPDGVYVIPLALLGP